MGYLSEIARRRIAALLLIAGIVLAALAIIDAGPFEDPPTEEERVQEVVERLYRAAAEGDFETYCSLLTRGARDSLRSSAAALVEGAGTLSCADIVEVAGDSLSGASLRVREVSVSGIRARVEADVKVPDTPLSSRTIFLEQDEAGEWLVSEPG